MRQPLRSSIACFRCRKSKIKCDNDGGTSACETCIKGSHNCQYPEIQPPSAKRSDSVSTRQERDGAPERKRKRLDDAWASRHGSAYAEDILSYPFLKSELWTQIFAIYKLHFSTELPFLQLGTLKQKMDLKQKGCLPSDPDVNLVLLGILTLTARFHPDLVKYVAALSSSTGNGRSRQTSAKTDPSAASDFYAAALTAALGSLPGAVKIVSLERVQAFLMLGLYEWTRKSQHAGVGAWMYVGIAIRMAQALRLGYEGTPNQNNDPRQRSSLQPHHREASTAEMITEREVRRRTMFSCFILDRILAVGDNRSSMISSADLHIQLPCSEMSFDLAKETYTGFLNQDENSKQPIQDDSVLSRFVRLVDLWGEITRYSFSGGRATEGAWMPWQEESTFYKLRQRLDAFYEDLPDTFTLSATNFYRHSNHQATSMYVSLHMLGSICQIMIHREYIPFIPVRCGGPTGPLDPPFIEEQAPPGFWEESAEHVFRSSKDIVELIQLAGDNLPQSSLILFAIWTAAFCGLYAAYFPHMDTKYHMISRDSQSPQTDIHDPESGSATGITLRALKRLAPNLPLADTYNGIFKGCEDYFAAVTKEYQQEMRRGNVDRHAGGRGVQGGGGREWKTHKGRITSNGNIFPSEGNRSPDYETTDVSMAGSSERGSPMTGEVNNAGRLNNRQTATPSVASPVVPTAASVPAPHSNPSVPFTPINNAVKVAPPPLLGAEQVSSGQDMPQYGPPQIAQEALAHPAFQLGPSPLVQGAGGFEVAEAAVAMQFRTTAAMAATTDDEPLYNFNCLENARFGAVMSHQLTTHPGAGGGDSGEGAFAFGMPIAWDSLALINEKAMQGSMVYPSSHSM